MHAKATQFLVYFLLLSNIEHKSLANVTNNAAKVSDPKDDLIIHFHDVDNGNF